MDIHKILIAGIFFVNPLQGMDICPEWERIRTQALTYAQSKDREVKKVSPKRNNQKQTPHKKTFKTVYRESVAKAKNIGDVLLLIRKQAQFGIILAKSHGTEKLLLNSVINKAKLGIKTTDMHYCLVTLEQFFTGQTMFYDVFNEKKSIASIQSLLINNMNVCKDDF